MADEIQRNVTIHGVDLARFKAIVNGKRPPERTLEEILADEEKRLGRKLEVKKNG